LGTVDEPVDLKITTDDWPFLYLRQPLIPWRPSLTGIVVMGAVSLLLIFAFRPPRAIRAGQFSFSGRMFFLGAGFMLLETKAVVNTALLFGSTWMWNTVVFTAILLMILGANIYVVVAKPRLLWPYYLGLLVALALNLFVPLDSFLGTT